MNALVLTSLLALAGQAPGDAPPVYTPEQLAVGAVREIISAQAVRGQSSPEAATPAVSSPWSRRTSWHASGSPAGG